MSRVAACLSSGVAVVFALSVYFSAPAGAASFQGIGFAPNGVPSSIATGVSADGSVVVGWNDVVNTLPQPHPDRFAFRWTKTGGMQILNPDDTLGQRATATGVSADGTAVCGYKAGDPYGLRAFRWTASGGMELLYSGIQSIPLQEDCHTDADGISGDGRFVVGSYAPGLHDATGRVIVGQSAMRWSRTGVELLYPLVANSAAVAASYDGSVTVGWREAPGSGEIPGWREIPGEVPYPTEACIWSERDGLIGLGKLSGATSSSAVAVSADGSVVVGWSGNEGNHQAFRWTAADGMVGLDFGLSRFVLGPTVALSADGSIIVGGGLTWQDTAFIWDADHGARNLKQVLTEAGLDLSGWELQHATGISADGMTIVGYGTNPSGKLEAWIAVVPEPAGLVLLLPFAAALLGRRRRGKEPCASRTAPMEARTRGAALAACSAFLLTLSACPSLRAATFHGLGFLPGSNYSRATGISANGSVVIGEDRGNLGFRWTGSDGMERLDVGNSLTTVGTGISADGSVIALGHPGFWTRAGGVEWLVSPDDYSAVWAVDISGNGLVLVGIRSYPAPGVWVPEQRPSLDAPLRWTRAGMEQLSPLDSPGVAIATSYDGSVTVGATENPDWFYQQWPRYYAREACVWDIRTGTRRLGKLPGGTEDSVATAVTPDGTVIAGVSGSVSGTQAFRWTSESGMIGLGDLSGGAFDSDANAISADGSVIVGRGRIASGDAAFIWDPKHGMRNLGQVLTELGINLRGWTLQEATGISADGMTIVGYGINPDGHTEAWIAVVPEPSSTALLVMLAAWPLHRRIRR